MPRVMTKAEIAAMQTELKRLGFYSDEIDGEFGPLSAAAVKLAQDHFGLPITGTVTFNLLVELRVLAPVPKKSNPITDFITRLVVNKAISTLKGLPIMNVLSGYKTYITAALMVALAGAALVGIYVPGFEGADPGTLLVSAFGLIFARVGTVKS